MSAKKRLFEFSGFRLDPDNHLLTHRDQVVPLTPKAFDTLQVLVERHGEVLSKEQLMQLVWPDTFVEEANLTQNIYTLRKTFAELGLTGPTIETIPRRGYRFVAPVVLVDGNFDTAAMPAFTAPPAGEAIAPSPLSTPPRPAAAPVQSAPGPSVLRRVLPWGVAALLALLLLGLTWLRGRDRAEPLSAEQAAPVASIAVLPFEPLNPGPDDAYLGLGMADALITRLSNQHQLIVRPTSAIRRYTEPPRDAVTIGRDLQVDAVLDGTLQRSGNTLRASVQLVATETGSPLWAQTFDASSHDLFDLQDQVSERLAAELQLRLSQRERARLTLRATSKPEAYGAYLRGRYFWNRRTEDGLWKALESFRQAIAIDPAYAAAYAGLADTYVLLPLFGSTPTGEAFPEAVRAAEQALALDPELAEAHTSLAYARFLFEWNWQAAEEGFKRAIDLNPNYATTHQWYAFLLAALGRSDEAVAEAQKAVELDPLSLVISTDLGMVYFFGRRVEEARAQFEKTLELDPSFAYAHFGLGNALLEERVLEQAVAEFERASQLSDTAINLGGLGVAYAAAGRQAAARAILDRLTEQSRGAYVDPSHLAVISAWLGDKKAAIELLDKACDERSRFAVFLDRWPPYEPLRNEPGWSDLVTRVGLPAHARP